MVGALTLWQAIDLNSMAQICAIHDDAIFQGRAMAVSQDQRPQSILRATI